MIWKWILQNITRMNLKAYLFFLVLTSAIWFLMKLSDNYDKSIDVPLRFTDIDQSLILVNNPVSSLSVSVTAEGFKMLAINGKQSKSLKVSLAGLKLHKGADGLFYGRIATRSLRPYITEQLDLGVTGRRFSPDSIDFVFDKRDTVTVPVKMDAAFEILPGFRIYGKPQIIPDKVRLTGPKHYLDTLCCVFTARVELKNLNAPFEKTVQLKSPSPLVKLSGQKVNLKVEIVEFIEAETEVPVRVYSDIPGLRVKTFPQTVKVTYQIAMPDYSKITDSLFEVGVNIDSLAALRNSSLIPKIYHYPDFVENPRLDTDKIDFVIIKN
jgi:hypothetical protein